MIPDCSLCKTDGLRFGLYQEKSTDIEGKVIYLFEIEAALSSAPFWLSRWSDYDWAYEEVASILVPGQLI